MNPESLTPEAGDLYQSPEYLKLLGEEIRAAMKNLADFRRRTHAFYCWAAGDWSKFGFTPQQVSRLRDQLNGDNIPEGQYYDIFVQFWATGRINHIKPVLRQYVASASLTIPDASIHGMSSVAQSIMTKYLDHRLSNRQGIGCHAEAEARRLAFDAVTCGLGWICSEFVQNPSSPYLRQTARYKSALRCYWDIKATTLDACRWWGFEDERLLSEWVRALGADNLPKEWFKNKGGQNDFKLRKLLHTFDLFGNECFWELTGGSVKPSPVFRRESAYCDEVEYGKRFFLPSVPVFWQQQAGVAIPQGLIEDAMPAIMALHEIEDTIRQQVRANAPILAIKRGSMEQKVIDALRASARGESYRLNIVEMDLKDAEEVKSALYYLTTGGIDAGLIQQHEYAVRTLDKVTGANPYGFGSAQPGVDTATEARAIDAETSGAQRAFALAFFNAWARLADIMLRMARHDTEPLAIEVADNVVVTFGGQQEQLSTNRYQDMYDLNFTVTVSDDQDKFKTRMARIAELEKMLTIQMQLNNPAGINEVITRICVETGMDATKMRVPMPTAPGSVDMGAEATQDGAPVGVTG